MIAHVALTAVPGHRLNRKSARSPGARSPGARSPVNGAEVLRAGEIMDEAWVGVIGGFEAWRGERCV